MQSIFKTYNRFPFEIVKGEGVTLFDETGKKYLDLTSGIGVCNLGYSSKKVKNAVSAQLDKVWHTSNLYESQLQENVAELLIKGADKKVYFCNSGTEANEAALKLARKATGKSKMMAFDHSFHGRSYGSLSLTGNDKIKEGFGPFLSDIEFETYNNFDSIEKIDNSFAAVILEVIQGEGGIVVGNYDWLQAVEAKCKETNVLLIIDEVQTGMGRTGKLFAYENYDLDPDIITAAKGLANGIPVGAMIGKAELADSFGPGSHGSTFGGNPLAMSAASAVLETLDNAFLDDVQQKASFLWYFLEKEISSLEGVDSISGKGLMIGIHINSSIPVNQVINELHKVGVLTLSSRGNTLRLLPPLTIMSSELLEGVKKIKEVLQNATVSL
ncbi:acetylornithine transaminase [Liquorilactobacillus mali]|uniref:Acetylornithine aminotransferase n=1 Tax=Liquorilactobacillus mali KCTC 3596 = DSM 20444 TaxID=1046596 RepID=J1F3H6_9LACO|nr:acetylornithine transaminase [Liquorilactobacillus mali]EJE99867.1 acetylornithine aminotransferase [Liquorilactobacillus mali KCTC 3596 = DSM 20444]KRN10328.1 acetylornithine aminotransferase [Liquorilactobacillus mali KCTC 3596 = DSM 20444]QFQ75864.1 acetylornithine transaminase [Liquorilactobacillus mali]